MNVPLIITLFRIFVSILFIFPCGLFAAHTQSLLFFLILTFVAATDYIDGYFARSYKQVTRLGSILDPLADKVFFVSSVLPLCIANHVSWYTFFAFIVRDFIVMSARELAIEQSLVIFPSKSAKLKTALTMILACITYIFPTFFLKNSLWTFTALLSIVSGFNYIKAVWKAYNE